MATEKKLIVAVEGTAALGPHWKTILSDYLNIIIRSFSDGANPELALVIFCTHAPYSDFVVQRSGWTKDIDVFLQWLSGIQFVGGGFNEVAIAEGLSEALMMFGSDPQVQKHCILIAASNPHPVPTPVYQPHSPNSEDGANIEAQTGLYLANAEVVARSLSQHSVSLSVISPRQLEKLREIYNAGKRFTQVTDSVVDYAKNPYFVVLISEDFKEARIALSRALIKNSSSNKKIANITVRVEPTTLPAMGPGPVLPYTPSISSVSSSHVPAEIANLEPAALPIMGPRPELAHIPTISSVSSSHVPAKAAKLEPVLPCTGRRPELSPTPSISSVSAQPTILPSMGPETAFLHVPKMVISSAMSGTTSVPVSTELMGKAQNIISSSSASASATPSLSVNPNIGTLPAQANLHGGSPASGEQIAQDAQMSPGIHSASTSNNPTMKMPWAQHGSDQQNQLMHFKIWEGELHGQRDGKPVIICRLGGYRRITTCETIAANWPRNLQIVRVFAQDQVDKQYIARAEHLTFHSLNTHGFFQQLQKKKLYAVVQLPGQTLLLSVSEKGRLEGKLFHENTVHINTKAPRQQPQMVGPGMSQQQQMDWLGTNHQQHQRIVGPGRSEQQHQQMVGPGTNQPQQQQMIGPGMSQLQHQRMVRRRTSQQQQWQQMVGPGTPGTNQQMARPETSQQKRMVGLETNQQMTRPGMSQQQRMVGLETSRQQMVGLETSQQQQMVRPGTSQYQQWPQLVGPGPSQQQQWPQMIGPETNQQMARSETSQQHQQITRPGTSQQQRMVEPGTGQQQMLGLGTSQQQPHSQQQMDGQGTSQQQPRMDGPGTSHQQQIFGLGTSQQQQMVARVGSAKTQSSVHGPGRSQSASSRGKTSSEGSGSK